MSLNVSNPAIGYTDSRLHNNPKERFVASATSLHDRFRNALTHRYFIRVHMTVMMTLVVLSGLLASRLLFSAGVTHMGIRYPIAVTISYLVFFGLVRLWIAYALRAHRARERAGRGSSSWDVGDLIPSGSVDLPGKSVSAVGKLAEGGGRFAGGGSSLSFAEGDVAAARPIVPIIPPSSTSSTSSKGSSSSSGFSLDLDGDGLWLLILFLLLVGAICGAGVYLVYQAPAILSEAAFQTVLASGLVKTARDAHDPGWMESVLKATIIPFAIVLVLAGVFGQQAHKRCPGAETVRQVFHQCIWRR
jgi:hypothetical protein